MNKRIEVELRSVIERLFNFFQKAGKLVFSGQEETWYFDGPGDLRTRRTAGHSKIIYKKGKLFDAQREELEIESQAADFDKLNAFLQAMGRKVYIKWSRKRQTFLWQGISVMLDDTKGYGCVVEFEKICQPEEKDKALESLKAKMKTLHVTPTDRTELKRRHKEYKTNWAKGWEKQAGQMED